MENQDKTSNVQGQSNIESQSMSTESGGGKKSFKESSPEEIKERVKETVAKGVAAVAGALKGFTDEAKKNDLAGSTKHAIQTAGETTRQVASTTKDEFQSTKGPMKEAIHKVAETTRDVATTAKDEAHSVKQEMKGSPSSGTPSTGGFSSGTSGVTGMSPDNASGSTSGGQKGGMGGSSLGTTPTRTGESSAVNTIGRSDVEDMPDIRKTEMSKTDRELSK